MHRKHYSNLQLNDLNQLKSLENPNKVLIQIGVLSVLVHILILLTMFFYSKFSYISNNMLNYEWFNGTITILLLIEHAVWLHLLWCLAGNNYYNLTIAYVGVLLLTISWVMEVVVPVIPDPFDHHGKFCIAFVFGCVVNLFSSLLLMPSHNTDNSYKYIISILGIFAVISSAIWYAWRIVNDKFKITDATKLQQFERLEPFFEITAFTAYLAGLGVGLDWARKISSFY